jgi:hypothetical protein
MNSALVLGFFVSGLLISGPVYSAAAATPEQSALARPKELPTQFIENQGQWSGESRFIISRGPVTASLEAKGIQLRLRSRRDALVRFAFEGANPEASLEGEGKSTSRLNFYVGNDPNCWRTNVPGFGSVIYRSLYPGVDLRVREESGRIEYDLLLAPGADLDRVVVNCEGARALSTRSDGSMEMEIEGGTLRQTPPRTWEVMADGRKRAVECKFRILGGQRYGFVVPDRDKSLPLVIDPGLEWSTLIGGSFSDQLTTVALARDGSGDIFVGGYMNSTDFPFFTDPNFTPEQNRVFVARLDATGSVLRWATLLGGWHSALVFRGLAAAPDGGVALVGQTVSPDFPTTPGAYQRTAKGEDVFVARLNSSGGLVFSTFLGGFGSEDAYGVGFDPSGSIIVGGTTSSADFPTTPGAIDRTYAEPTNAAEGDAHGDVYLTRFTSDGSAVTYSTYIGGQSADVLEDMVVDSLGYVTIVGWITGHNVEVFPTTSDAFDRTWNGSQDCFLARIKPDGAGAGDLKYSTLIGGSNMDNFYGVAVDPNNPALVTAVGMTWSDNFPVTPGVVDPTNPRFSDLFESQSSIAVRFNLPAGGPGTRIWSTYFGPDKCADIRATDVAINNAGEPIMVGLMGSRDLATTRGAFDRLPEGELNGGNNFIVRLSADARQAPYVSYFGGSLADSDQFYLSPALAYIGGNTVIVASSTSSIDFPVTEGAFDTTYNSVVLGSDGYVMRFTAEPDDSGDLTVASPTLVSPPNGVTFGSGSTKARFQWTAVVDPAGIDGYEAELSTNPNFTNAIRLTSHTTEYLYPGAVSGEAGLSLGTWFWRVRAFDYAGNISAWSSANTFSLNVPSAPAAINFMGTYPAAVVGGAPAVGILYLDKPAPAGGAVAKLALRYNQSVGLHAPHLPFPVTIPETVAIPEGALTVLFEISTAPVNSSVAVDIFATINGVGTKNHITVKPPATVDIRDLSITPVNVTGGNPSTGKVTLKDVAPAGGVVVQLTTGHPQAARVPASVTIPEGERSAIFPITTFPVEFDIDTVVRASTAFSTAAKYIFVQPASGLRLNSFTINPNMLSGGMLATGTISLNASAPIGTWPAFDGVFVDISSNRPDIIGLAPFITIYNPDSSGTFTFLARNVPTPTSIVLTAAYDNFVLTAPVTISAGPPVNITSVTVNAPTLIGGHGGIATANLGVPAPSGGIGVTFSASEPDIYFSSDPVAFASQGSTSASVAFIANPVAATKTVNIIASYGNSSASVPVTINPSDGVERWPTSITLSPRTVVGGNPSTCTVTINTAAPLGGSTIRLSSSHSAATVLSTVIVPQGATSVSFPVNTAAVSANTSVQIWALLNFSMAAALEVTPGAAPPATPGTPSLLSPANDSRPSQPIFFDWTDPSNAASYEIQIDDGSGFSAPLVRNLTSTASQISVSGLASVRHWWRVRARNSAGIAGNWSSSRRFTPQAAPAAASLSAISVNPSSVVGGNASQGTVTLSSAAPSGGAIVTLSSSNPSIASMPASVTVPSGATSASFSIATAAVTANTSVTLSANYSGVTRITTLTLTPPPPPASLSSLSLSPTTVIGGNNSQGTVHLTSPAPSGGLMVALSSSSADATVPASVLIGAGSTSASFSVTTRTVTTSTSAIISGSLNSVSRSSALTINPASTGPLPAPGLVSPANDARFSPGQNITFDWNNVSGAASYTIQIDDHDSFPSPWLVNQTATASTFSTSTLPTRTMWWRVRANDAGGTPGNWSSVRRVEVKD